MRLAPERRLIALLLACAALSLEVIVFPSSAAILVVLDLILLCAVAIDLAVSPSFRAIKAERRAPARTVIKEPARVFVDVENRSRATLRLTLKDGAPAEFLVATEEISAALPGHSRETLEYVITPIKRGRHAWGAMHFRVRSQLGLWCWTGSIAADFRTDVYPNLAGIERYQVLAAQNLRDQTGARRVRLKGGAWEFESLRDYALGDDIRAIDWKATARHSKLIVKNHQPERNQTLIILLDFGRLMNAEVKGDAKIESAMTAALILTKVALSRGDRVGLCTFSNRVRDWVVPRARMGQYPLIADTLFDLQADYNESDHGRALRLIAKNHRKRSLIVVLTDFVDAATAAEMTAHLALASRRHLVLFVAFGDPFLRSAARGEAHTLFEGFRKASAIELLHDRFEVLETLRRSGALVIDAEPDQVTPELINRYVEIVLGGLI